MNIAAEPQFPAKWPFPPAPPSRSAQPRRPRHHAGQENREAGGMGAQSGTAGISNKQMVTDILLVAMWGAMIPGLMWLGAALGF